MERADHPVWEVYDLHRTARLNVKYYSAKLGRTERINFWLELILACTAPSSVVAGLWFWQTPIGHLFWQGAAGVAAFIAVVKPLLGHPKKIKEYESVLSGYRTLVHDLNELGSHIRNKKRYDPVAQKDYRLAMNRLRSLIGKSPDARENTKLKAICEKQVQEELPSSAFYVPEE